MKFSKWSIIIIFLYHMLYFGVCFGLSNPDLIMKSRGFMIAWISNVSPSVMSMNRYTFRTFKNYETFLFGHLRIMRHPCTKRYRYQCGNHSKGIFQDVNSIYWFSSYHIFLLYLFYIFNAYYEFLECYVSKLSCFGACFDKFFILLSWYSGIKKIEIQSKIEM